MNLTNGQVQIIVRPSVRGIPQPFTAYIGGTRGFQGYGQTVQAAVEDLFTSEEAGQACRQLEKEVER